MNAGKADLTVKDFFSLVDDVLHHEDVQKLRKINHHGKSILRHSLRVGFLSCFWGRRLGLDLPSLGRGALLHDFFLYDWNSVRFHPDRKFYEVHKMHGFIHPGIALENAAVRFHLNKVERDIIRRHMFPLTLIPPRYPESWLVMLADKWVSISEIPQYLRSLKKRLKAG